MKNLLKNFWSVLIFPFVCLYMYFAGGKSSASTDAQVDVPVVTTSGDAVVATSGDAVVASSNQQNKEPDALDHLLKENQAENQPKATSKYRIMAGCVAGFAFVAALGGSSESGQMPVLGK